MCDEDYWRKEAERLRKERDEAREWAKAWKKAAKEYYEAYMETLEDDWRFYD